MTALDRLLVELAKGFRERHIRYGIGGSRLLQFHGIDVQPHDLDFILDIADFAKADAYLRSIGTPVFVEHDELYRTGSFSRFEVHGASVDLIADFTISNHDTRFTYPFSEDCLSEPFPLDSEKVSACRLEDWYLLYQLMNDRKGRVVLIAAHFRKKGDFDRQRFLALVPDREQEFEAAIKKATEK